jgi:TonB-dependent starch-binding outer membrane protein SusC
MRAFTVRAMIGASVALMFGSVSLSGQTVGRIRGSVTDAATNLPIGEGQIAVLGTASAAATNASGSFALDNVPAGPRTVRIRRLGYAQIDTGVTVPEGGEVRLDVTLRAAPSVLSQVVVTGTAEATTRRQLGNAVTIVNAEEENSRSVNQSVTDLLQSKAPGVSVLPGSGAPGTAGEIRIRGASSISGYKPVIYIDGIRYNDGQLGNFNPTGSGQIGQAQSTQVTSALDFLNPNDIESIEVIKGPAAATLYGAEAAAGVIQVITKKGTRGQQATRWTARYERGENEWALDTPVNYTFCNQAKVDSTNAAGPVWPGCQGRLNQFITDEPMRRDPDAMRVGDLEKVSLSLRGGGDRYSFYVSGDHDRDEGIFFNSFARRRSGRGNFGFVPTEKLDFGVNVSYIHTDLRLPFQDETANSVLLSAARGKPGRVSVVGEGWSTASPRVSNRYKNNTVSDRMTFGATANFRPKTWFRNRFIAGLDYTASEATLLLLPGEFDTPEGYSAKRVPRTRVYTLDYSGSVDKQLPWNLLSTTSIGSQVVSSRTERLDASGTGLGAPDVTIIGTATITAGNNTFSEQNSVGYYVQEQLAWRDRLYVTGAVRADDNSSFGEDFDVMIYPKASIAWVLSEEPRLASWMETIRADEFKLRAAWGKAGRAPLPFSAVQTYTIDKTPFAAAGGTTTSVPILRASAYGNPNLAPEKSQEIEIGFDAGLFNHRAGVDFTFYSKRTEDLLQSTPAAPSLGFPGNRQVNLGEVTNRGIELSLYGTPLQFPNFAWDTRMNLATNRNRLVSFGIPGRLREAVPTQPYGAVQEHRPEYPLGGYWARLPQRNADGSPVVVGSTVQLETDAQYIGPSMPTREIGFSNTFTFFKNVRLYALLDYKSGHYIFNVKESNRCISNDNCARVNQSMNARLPQTAADSVLWREFLMWRQVTSVYIEKADFIKLRDLSLSYTVPRQWLAKTGAEGATITLTGKNLALWSDYSGIDPEVNSYGGRIFGRVDAYASPMVRRLTMSMTVNY